MLSTAAVLAAIATAAVALPPRGCEVVEYSHQKLQYFFNNTDFPKLFDVLELEQLPLSDVKISTGPRPSDELEARNVTLFGLDSVYPSGDTYWCDGTDTGSLALYLKWRFLELTVAKLNLAHYGVTFSSSFRLHGAELGLGFSLKGDINDFSLRLDALQFVTLGSKVTMSSSRAEYDGKDTKEFFNDLLLPYANQQLEQTRKEFNKQLLNRQLDPSQLLEELRHFLLNLRNSS